MKMITEPSIKKYVSNKQDTCVIDGALKRNHSFLFIKWIPLSNLFIRSFTDDTSG